MRTEFTEAQLLDPEMRESNQILRTCVHCGFCTATCPTFVLLGDELDSPRGRIYLIKDMLESGRAASEEETRHVDRCLSCLSCMTTCPSGVHYMHLVDHARHHIEETYKRPLMDRLLRGVLAKVLPRPALFRAALAGARAAKPLKGLLGGTSMTAKRLRAMLELAPEVLPPPGESARATVYRGKGERRGRVALLTGCAQTVLAPSINEATIRLLTRMGLEVIVTARQGCCGALTHHMGRQDESHAQARRNIEAWAAEAEGEGLDAIVINASGCGTTVKDYGHMFREAAPMLRDRAARISELAKDVSEVLAKFGYAPSREPPGITVAYHAACSLQHGQQITGIPKSLLEKAGFTVRVPQEAHLCCGSAGTYNILQPEIAAKLRDRKLEFLHRTGADIVASGNIGCLTQLGGGGLPVAHTVELLDWMAGGPAPAAVAATQAGRETLAG
ncbi:glycolate oxidase subunit GlcF [Roseomonas xinghualingensis]|uniref:glycolate oxidase subunit GlcF n=1 Tax=Roseomonas xinghualingensis TaxID=2986475 RepID=UPI0021F23491|nr:glycolate oxidase subunit GlcF [Roseomonas sp. SXEYE001]MCV4207336.1 glycolate oxidase subunit GlcF [Roseomonas sp. SXEYE001]